ncbi:helicase HerA-like domain-containing protein, partial [Janibacter sp. RAF20_2_2]
LLTQLGTGEAVVTVLSEKGTPTPVAHTMMRAPQSLMSPSAPELLEQTAAGSALAPKYAEALDRESAYEKLAAKLEAAPAQDEAKGEPAAPPQPTAPTPPKDTAPTPPKEEPGVAFRSALRSAGTVIGREITRSIFGTSRRRR